MRGGTGSGRGHGVGSGALGTSSSSAPPSSRNRRSAIRSKAAISTRVGMPVKLATSAAMPARTRRGTGLHEMLDPFRLGHRRGARRASPTRAREVCPRLLPGPERRYPDEVEPEPRAVPRRRVEPERSRRSRHDVSVRRPGTARSSGPRRLPRSPAAEAPYPPLAPVLSDRGREQPEVAPRCHVDRRSHHPRLHDRLPMERSREVVAPEAVQPGPKSDVPRRGVLASGGPRHVRSPGGCSCRVSPGDPAERGGHGSALARRGPVPSRSAYLSADPASISARNLRTRAAMTVLPFRS